MNVRKISPLELHRRRFAGEVIHLIDVQTPKEYAGIHVEGARLEPIDRLDPAALAAEFAHRNGAPLCVICQAETRSLKACAMLQEAGIEDLYCVEGGTLGWEKAGLPVMRGEPTFSLERQVRIVAGALVLAGILLGWFVHPAFLALSAFVGAGLVFAGATGTCGMALLLARMPWNRIR